MKINITIVILLIVLALALPAYSQTNKVTYQGSLNFNDSPANGNFDFQFRIFSALTGGSQVGAAISVNNVQVTDGAFAVTLDTGNRFDGGADRWLEIRVRQTGGAAVYATLTPRQPITSSPYSIRSKLSESANTALNATQLGSVAASQYVLTSDARLSDERPPAPGSVNYVQNSTNEQSGSNFYISGIGRADILAADAQINLGSTTGPIRFVHNGGARNTFVGQNTAESNTGFNNSFFGFEAGQANSEGDSNSYFGQQSGNSNTTGSDNSFFGKSSGRSNTVGVGNSFFGRASGLINTTGQRNAFFGENSGSANSSGSFNAFFGGSTGGFSAVGSNNTAIGFGAFLSDNLSFATAIGSNASIAASNTIQLGRAGKDVVRIGTTDAAGSTNLCLNNLNAIATCSSSIRYKSEVESFSPGLDLIRRLRPVSFKWKDGGMSDMGLVAEEVAEVEPLLTTTRNGKIEGVKYDRVGVVLVNAVQEQQEQIEKLKEKVRVEKVNIDEMSQKLKALEAIVCELKPEAEVCKSIED
ncbi:MAG: tail fiber domain-containing protein [Pyrinomonadaceae bacterium]|nr:tail fiber domain-containing protein [Pyrinomonadaceae bacterium]